jgi:hypothetical protein
MNKKYTFKQLLKILIDWKNWKVKDIDVNDAYMINEKENIRYIKGTAAVVLMNNSEDDINFVHESTIFELPVQIIVCKWLEYKVKN